jgi:hypothetical protein
MIVVDEQSACVSCEGLGKVWSMGIAEALAVAIQEVKKSLAGALSGCFQNWRNSSLM